MKKSVENIRLDGERALYGSVGLCVRNVRFEGPADGESALKECSDIDIQSCYFDLRYPLWHVHGLNIADSHMTELCRAALWYSDGIRVTGTKLYGIKALRECAHIEMSGCDIVSPEFGWRCDDLTVRDTRAAGEYFMFMSRGLDIVGLTLKGKYSFQYVENAVFDGCEFDTKDAFWHGKNITVKNSIVKGEYLGWYSEGLTFENCTISGTQPLCYCKGLKLIDCKMIDADLCFERSDVNASITTPVVSIKNVLSGRVTVPSVGEIIKEGDGYLGEIAIAPRDSSKN